MKQKLIILTFLIINSLLYSQNIVGKKSFEKLTTFSVNYNEKIASFTIDTSNSIIYNEKFEKISNKPKGFKLTDFECEINAIILAEVIIDKTTNRKAILTFGICPEFEFYLYDIKTKKLIGYFSALNITIPGNNAIYTSGHLSEFNVRQKFEINDYNIKEKKQPYYYVGLKSITLKSINIYTDKELTEVLAVLPKGYEVEVLLAEKSYDNRIYLVKTSFGLIGWTKLKAEQYKSVDIEGLFYNND